MKIICKCLIFDICFRIHIFKKFAYKKIPSALHWIVANTKNTNETNNLLGNLRIAIVIDEYFTVPYETDARN